MQAKQVYNKLLNHHDKPINHNIIKSHLDQLSTQDLSHVIRSTDQPDIITSNTIGAYLWGCFQPELATSIACTPACINAVSNPKLQSCKVNVYEKRLNKLTKLYHNETSHANIYLASNQLLNNQDVKQLLKDGITSGTLYYQDNNTINYIMGDSFDLSDNILNKSYSNSILQNIKLPVVTYNNPWLWFVVLGVIIILLFILFIGVDLANQISGYHTSLVIL